MKNNETAGLVRFFAGRALSGAHASAIMQNWIVDLGAPRTRALSEHPNPYTRFVT
jgi:hypothetical protein